MTTSQQNNIKERRGTNSVTETHQIESLHSSSSISSSTMNLDPSFQLAASSRILILHSSIRQKKENYRENSLSLNFTASSSSSSTNLQSASNSQQPTSIGENLHLLIFISAFTTSERIQHHCFIITSHLQCSTVTSICIAS